MPAPTTAKAVTPTTTRLDTCIPFPPSDGNGSTPSNLRQSSPSVGARAMALRDRIAKRSASAVTYPPCRGWLDGSHNDVAHSDNGRTACTPGLLTLCDDAGF